MRKFSFLLVLLFVLLGCSDRKVGQAQSVHWDRDMCERCKMAVSDRNFAFEIINPKTNKVYVFDDIGCGILWLEEEKIPWRDSAIMWVTDAKTGKWIDAKKALYTDDSITPMAYGFAAYTKETKPKGKNMKDFKYIKRMVFEIEKLNSQKVQNLGQAK